MATKIETKITIDPEFESKVDLFLKEIDLILKEPIFAKQNWVSTNKDFVLNTARFEVKIAKGINLVFDLELDFGTGNDENTIDLNYSLSTIDNELIDYFIRNCGDLFNKLNGYDDQESEDCYEDFDKDIISKDINVLIGRVKDICRKVEKFEKENRVDQYEERYFSKKKWEIIVANLGGKNKVG